MAGRIMNRLNPLNYYRRSLGAKIFYLFTAFVILVYLSFMGFFLYYQSMTLKENLMHEGRQLAGLLASNSKLGVFAENEDLLKDPVEAIMQNPQVILVQVFAIDGTELKMQARPGGKTPEKSFGKYSGRKQSIINTIKKSRSVFQSETGNEIEFWAPVISGGEYTGEEAMFFEEDLNHKKGLLTGFVKIVFSKGLLKENLHSLFLNSFLISLFFIIPGWFVIYLIVRGITKPLNSLTEGVKAIETEGSAEKISSINTEDEIGRLAQAFNHMAETLKEKEAEKQQLEEQLRHSQKMEAIGTLAGGIAHDFNNVLTGVIGFSQLIQLTLREDDPMKHHIQQILTSAQKGADLTRNLLAFGRKQILTPEPVDVNGIIDNIKQLLSRVIGADVELVTALTKESLTIMADSGQIEQVLLNLATNASDAMPDGGYLTITTKSLGSGSQFSSLISKIDGQQPTPAGNEKTGQYAVISVTDTGTGIDRDVKERIFDPFFTTKGLGEGTGLGLSMAYGIIKQHNGYIDVISEPGKETTFEIFLPLSGAVVKEKTPENLPMPEGGTETILLAEDDETVRLFISSILEQYGYTVIEAVDGKDAVRKFTENKDKIELALLDVIMPKMNGAKVSKEIQEIRPGIRTLFISGYTANVMFKKKILDEGTDFIQKPVSTYDLCRKVREVLDK